MPNLFLYLQAFFLHLSKLGKNPPYVCNHYVFRFTGRSLNVKTVSDA